MVLLLISLKKCDSTSMYIKSLDNLTFSVFNTGSNHVESDTSHIGSLLVITTEEHGNLLA